MKKYNDIVYNNIHSDILNIIKTSGNITREHAKDTAIKLAHSLTKVFIKLGEKDFAEIFAAEKFLKQELFITKLIKQRDDLLEFVDPSKNKDSEFYENYQNLLELFWVLLRNTEVHLKKEDILDKINVEDSYKLWNKIHNTNLIPDFDKIK